MRSESCLQPDFLDFLDISKSRSSPSNLLVLKYVMLLLMNTCLLAEVASMAVILVVPKFQPPTASKVLRSGFEFFRSLKRSYLIILNNLYFTGWIYETSSSPHTTPHHTTSHPTISHHIPPYHTTPPPHHTISNHITSHPIMSHHTLSHHITSHSTISNHITPHHKNHFTPHHITPY